jgi:phosphatidylinositol alpha-1,6-mannosyltransferase
LNRLVQVLAIYASQEHAVFNKRQVLLVTNDLGPRAGGIETFILGLIAQLDGAQLLIYTSSQEGSEEFDQQLSSRTGALVIRDKSKVLLPTPRVMRAVAALMNDYQSEIIWFGAAAPLGWMAGYLRKKGAQRLVSLTHGHEVWWAKVPPFSWILMRISKNLDVVTYLGSFTKKVIGRSVADASKLVQIAPGIPIDHFTPGRKDASLVAQYGLSGKKVIVCVGRLVHRKGQDRLLEALAEIITREPQTVVLFVGIGPRKAKLDVIIRKHKLESYVVFAGRVAYKDLPRYFRLGDIFVMPSRSRLGGLEVEGLGIVYLEASACGLPVIAGSSGGAPDAVLANETGLVVDGRDTHAIAHAVTELFADPALIKKMGEAGRAWIVDQWSWDLWGGKFKDVLFGDHSAS